MHMPSVAERWQVVEMALMARLHSPGEMFSTSEVKTWKNVISPPGARKSLTKSIRYFRFDVLAMGMSMLRYTASPDIDIP
ncbi:MAG: hypothetical protein A4E28_00350 [Methanocella sp. PtaU1.Bin125]|nr:MAG: hypothetical protein A4E28_00350 [Methanocella sp. PtaU1.Bin125]